MPEIENQTTLTAPAHNYRKASPSFVVLRFLVSKLLRLLFQIDVKGLEKLPKQGGYILAGNHLSWIDPFLMLAFAPAEPRIYFIAHRKNMEKPAYRKFFTERIGGIIPLDTEQPGGAYREIAGKVKEVLAGGGVLGIFPEGDVSAVETGRTLPLKKGIGHFASTSGKPIVPVAFSGTKELWLRKPLKMIVGAPIPGQGGGKLVAEQLTALTAEAILAVLPPPAAVDPFSRKLLRNFFTNLFTNKDDTQEHTVPK